jgi:putative ABC transport system permease protein
MLSAVTARTRELASLLAMGATQWQVRALTLIDGLLLGVGGGIGGMVLGVCSAYPIVSRVTTDALGWSLTFSLAPIDIILLTIGLLVASLLASFYPSSVAAGIPMGEATGVE